METPAPLPIQVEAVTVRRDPLWYLALGLLFGIHSRVIDPGTLLEHLTVVTNAVASSILFVVWAVASWRRRQGQTRTGDAPIARIVDSE